MADKMPNGRCVQTMTVAELKESMKRIIPGEIF